MFGKSPTQTTEQQFTNRREAGKQLARKLLEETLHNTVPDNTIVMALPRGGVPVAYEVALALKVPLDVFLVRKIGVPWHEELAMGAIASGGVSVLDLDTAQKMGVSDAQVDAVVQREQKELKRRAMAFRGTEVEPDLRDRTVILVDDGLATGSTMRAATQAVKKQVPKRLIVAVPVAPPDVCETFRSLVDAVVCLVTPEKFNSVGLWYKDFNQTTDSEVSDLLAEAKTKISQAA